MFLLNIIGLKLFKLISDLNNIKKCVINISKCKFFFILFFSVVFSYEFAYSATPTSIIVVKNHQPNAVIVLPDSASISLKNAAKLLQNYIQQSTGALLPINHNVQGKNVSIDIGLTSFVKKQKINFKNIDEDGFILKAINAHSFIIVGGSDWGSEFGIYSFLERFLGVAWLIPTSIGTDIPSQANLILPAINITDNPSYISRQIEPVNIGTKTDLGEWGRFNRLRGRISFSHNLLHLFDPKEFYKTNPDFYPKGRTEQSLSGYDWQPNFSAPGIADSASAKIVRYFKNHPTVTSYSLGMNDYTIFDQSPQSLIRRNGRKNFLGLEDVSDDYFEWVNKVVQKVSKVYPHKRFGLLAYENLAAPPSRKIDRNVIPFLTYERLRWSNTLLENQGHQLTERWAKLCTFLGWYDYTYGWYYLAPRVWFHEMQKYLIWGSTHHVKYYFAELYPNWGEGPKAWIQAKLLWNPDYNVDSLLNVWFVKTAGVKAAVSLKQFYKIWETFWTKDIFLSGWNTSKGEYLPFNNFSYLDAIPKSYIEQSETLMNEAFRLADTDLQKQRVGELLHMWHLYKAAMELYQGAASAKKSTVLSSSNSFITLLNTIEEDPLYSSTIGYIKKSLKIK
jgi:hypothetical protein